MKQPATKVYHVALYMRLSRDDESYGDSVSIQTQREILQQYAREHALRVVDEYIDDGWSGTNFERPAFQRMLKDIEEGKVNCVITKDLSRFGREHVMMDYYLEFVFPEKRVRYIAVTENEDTEKGLSDFVPFKNLFNEWFAKDTSRKVKAAFRAKFEAGERIGNCAPLGYVKDPDRKNHLIIDEENRWIIERIFELALQGKGPAAITKVLVAEKVPTAGWITYQRTGIFAKTYAGAPVEKRYAWTICQVRSILIDETYIGHTIHYQQKKISYKSKKNIRTPNDEWYRVENTHEPIIEKDVFRQVREQMANRRRSQKDGTLQIFAGLVKCADCGWSLVYTKKTHVKKPYAYYRCNKNAQGLHQCTMHYIRYDVLYEHVLTSLQYWSAQVQKNETKVLTRLLQSSSKGGETRKKKTETELTKIERRKAEVDRLFVKIYEDWSSERLTESNFNMLFEKYQKEQQELEEKILLLKKKLSEAEQSADDAERWVCELKKYGTPTELTAELLNALIEKILVHEAVKDENGKRTQEIELYYRFIGKID